MGCTAHAEMSAVTCVPAAKAAWPIPACRRPCRRYFSPPLLPGRDLPAQLSPVAIRCCAPDALRMPCAAPYCYVNRGTGGTWRSWWSARSLRASRRSTGSAWCTRCGAWGCWGAVGVRSAEPAGCSRKHERGACRCCCCFAVPKPPAACWPPADCCHQSSSLTNCSTAPHPRPTGHLGGAAGDCACCGRHGHQDARGGGHVTNCTWGPNEIDSQTLAVAAPLSCEMGRMRLQPQLPNPPPALLPEYQFFHCSRPFSCIATAPLRHCKSPALQPRQTAASRAKPHPAAAPQLWTAALFNSGRLPSRSLPPARCRASSYMGRGPPLPKGCECTAATGCLQGPHALSAYFRSGKARAFLAAFSVLALACVWGEGGWKGTVALDAGRCFPHCPTHSQLPTRILASMRCRRRWEPPHCASQRRIGLSRV